MSSALSRRTAGFGSIESKEVRDDGCLITIGRQTVGCLDRAVVFPVCRPQLSRYQVRVIERGEGSVRIMRTRRHNPLRPMRLMVRIENLARGHQIREKHLALQPQIRR